MAREPRVDTSGYYHLSNRGVGLREVYLSHEDRIFFISMLCNCAKQYSFHIHGYALIANGYNILIETTKNNLSIIMKMVNSRYSSYFNRRQGRRGHLWEGRFKSWFIEDEGFVLDILSYIEHLPIYTGATTDKQNYFYASYRQFIGTDECLPCVQQSIVFKKFNNIKEIKLFFNKPIDFERINSIHRLLQKTSRKRNVRPKKVLASLPKDYFTSSMSNTDRNKKILKAYNKGYSQTMLGQTLGISQQAVYKIIRKLSKD